MLDVKNVGPDARLRLRCENNDTPFEPLRIGAQSDKWSLQQLSPDQLFVSYDTGALPAGCSVQAIVDTQAGVRSQPYTLARIIRLPQMEQLSATADAPVDGKRTYTLLGHNLEMIAKLGWDQSAGFDVTELPVPIPGPGQRQSLRFSMPDPPSATSPVYVWLRGETAGRATTVVPVSNPGTAAP
jgi:hypothetical protein